MNSVYAQENHANFKKSYEKSIQMWILKKKLYTCQIATIYWLFHHSPLKISTVKYICDMIASFFNSKKHNTHHIPL